jgi:undecaprenyl-diphosphatase
MGRSAGARRRGPAGWLLPEGYSRHPGDLLRLALALLVLGLTLLVIHEHRVGVREVDIFRVVNDLALPGWTDRAVWALMQLGVIGAVPVVVAMALAARRLRLALDAAVAAGSIYLIAKLVKEIVQRGRPQTLLDGVHILGEPARGLGYVSGHSAVAVALATVAGPYLGRRARRVAWALAAGVCLARMYVGAHLPLDVLGGAALGWAAGALVHLALGVPRPRASVARVRDALRARGFDPEGLEPLGAYGRRSTRLVTPELFVKAVAREWRDTDLLYRAWRRIAPHRGPRPLPQGSPLEAVEHEAAMALLAAAAGVRTPRVLLVGSFRGGAGLLVERRVGGRTLEDLEPGEIDDGLLAELWRQVDILHGAGIAHGELTGANVMVDGEGQPWLVDFDRAVAGADRRRRERDVAELRAWLAGVIGADRVDADAAARAAVDRDTAVEAGTT